MWNTQSSTHYREASRMSILAVESPPVRDLWRQYVLTNRDWESNSSPLLAFTDTDTQQTVLLLSQIQPTDINHHVCSLWKANMYRLSHNVPHFQTFEILLIEKFIFENVDMTEEGCFILVCWKVLPLALKMRFFVVGGGGIVIHVYCYSPVNCTFLFLYIDA